MSAKYLSALQKAGVRPAKTHDLAAMRSVLSTGSPLTEGGFRYVCRDVRPGAWLASISGGTDILSCFVLGNPWLPVHVGEIQCKGLGMAVHVFDESGRPAEGIKGELVCTKSFPSAPVGFWNDPGGSPLPRGLFRPVPATFGPTVTSPRSPSTAASSSTAAPMPC